MRNVITQSIYDNIINSADKVTRRSDSDWWGAEKVISATKDGVTFEFTMFIDPDGDKTRYLSVLGTPFDIDRRSCLYSGGSSSPDELIEEMVEAIIDQYDSRNKSDVQTIMHWMLDDSWRRREKRKLEPHRFNICLYNTERNIYDIVDFADTWEEVAAFGDPINGSCSASLRYYDYETDSWGWCCEV